MFGMLISKIKKVAHKLADTVRRNLWLAPAAIFATFLVL